MTAEEAGELLGMSGRNFRRLCERYQEEGIEGLRDRRLERPSPRRAPESELERMRQLYRECYALSRAATTPEALAAHQKAEIEKWWPIKGSEHQR